MGEPQVIMSGITRIRDRIEGEFYRQLQNSHWDSQNMRQGSNAHVRLEEIKTVGRKIRTLKKSYHYSMRFTRNSGSVTSFTLDIQELYLRMVQSSCRVVLQSDIQACRNPSNLLGEKISRGGRIHSRCQIYRKSRNTIR
jgi:hypothetical protein